MDGELSGGLGGFYLITDREGDDVSTEEWYSPPPTPSKWVLCDVTVRTIPAKDLNNI